MTHLTPDEIVDLIEGASDGARQAHLEACDACRARVAAIRESLAAVRAVTADEPSPLFWDHFAARVRRVIDAPPPRASRPAWLAAPIGALAVLVAVAVLSVAWPRLRSSPADVRGQSEAVTDPWPAVDDPGGIWDLVLVAASGLAWEDAAAAGLAVRPGGADRAFQSLSAEERAVLVRLIEEALADPVSSG